MNEERLNEARESLLQAARQESAPEGLVDRVRQAGVRAAQRKKFRQLSLGGTAFVLAAASLLAVQMQRSAKVPMEPEEVAPLPTEPAAASHQKNVADPCLHPTVAKGTSLLFDDFENDERGPVQEDGRRERWFRLNDLDTNQRRDVLKADPLPPELASPDNRAALHMKGGELREWGAALEYEFRNPKCYDASAYGGIKFRMAGKARVHFAMREIDNIPRKYGGLCDENCWIHHVKVVDSGEGWQTFELHWDVLRRRGYDSGPLDTSRIHSIQFLVQPEDTPFDFWIDDVEFLPLEDQSQ